MGYKKKVVGEHMSYTLGVLFKNYLFDSKIINEDFFSVYITNFFLKIKNLFDTRH